MVRYRMRIGSTDDPGTCPRCWRVEFRPVGREDCFLHESPSKCVTRQCAHCTFKTAEHVARSLMLAEQQKATLRERAGVAQA